MNVDVEASKLKRDHSIEDGEFDIDFEQIKAKDFMKKKEGKHAPNRKLKDFYNRYTEQNEVSVFTMAENSTLLKETELFVNPEIENDTNPIYKKIAMEKGLKKDNSQQDIKIHFDAQPVIQSNTKELKTL